MRRRGCLIGVGGILVSIILCCALGYFVALPRFHDQIEEELTQVLSTEVAREIDSQVASAGSVQAGTYRMSVEDMQREIMGGSDNLTVEGLFLRAEGEEIVLGFEVENADAQFRFTPRVTPEGYLDMSEISGTGGIVKAFLGPDSIANAVETSVNNYLQANGLFLEDVRVEGDELVLILGDR
jgi:hypothetical protein